MKFPKGCPKVEFYREPEYCEIVLYLFERCNLRCEFCFQEHEHAQINCDYIKHLPEAAFQLMSKELRAHPTIKSFDIRMLGGEIFADDLPNELFDLLKNMGYKDIIIRCLKGNPSENSKN